MELTSHHQPEEFRKHQKAMPRVLPPPRILLAGIHLGWAMPAPPGRSLSANDWPQNAGNSPHHHKTQDFELSGRATLGSLTLMLSAWAPFPSVFCFVSSCMSPRTVHFPVLNKSPQRPWKRSPLLQHLNLWYFHLRNRGRLDKEHAGELLERPLGYQY